MGDLEAPERRRVRYRRFVAFSVGALASALLIGGAKHALGLPSTVYTGLLIGMTSLLGVIAAPIVVLGRALHAHDPTPPPPPHFDAAHVERDHTADVRHGRRALEPPRHHVRDFILGFAAFAVGASALHASSNGLWLACAMSCFGVAAVVAALRGPHRPAEASIGAGVSIGQVISPSLTANRYRRYKRRIADLRYRDANKPVPSNGQSRCAPAPTPASAEKTGLVTFPRHEESGDDAVLLFIVVAVGASVLSAGAYLEFRDLLLAIAGTMIAASLGIVVGNTWRLMRLGLFASDWQRAVYGIAALAGAALTAGYFLFSPLWAPSAYLTLYDAYRKTGWSSIHLFTDHTAMIFAFQGFGMFCLVAASAILFWTSACLNAKGLLLAKARTTPVRRAMAKHVSGSRIMAYGLSFMVLLAGAVFFGSGYAGKVWARSTGFEIPQLLVPTVAVENTPHPTVIVRGVATADGRLEIMLRSDSQQRNGHRSAELLYSRRLTPGTLEIVETLPNRFPRPTAISLLPESLHGTLGTATRFTCDAASASCSEA